jgi:nucleotidyltransferase/DNA polymerase involved in DNA repair
MDLFNKSRKWHLECEVYSLKVIKVKFQLYSAHFGNIFQNFMLLNKFKPILEANL